MGMERKERERNIDVREKHLLEYSSFSLYFCNSNRNKYGFSFLSLSYFTPRFPRYPFLARRFWKGQGSIKPALQPEHALSEDLYIPDKAS